MNTTGLRFEKILVKVEQGVHLALEQARLETDHGLTIGEQAEAAVRAMLRNYLPNGYSVGRGHVHDAYGERSRQTDVVIANPDHPLTYPEAEKSGTYVVDGVSAAGEVKAKLTLPKLDDCIQKGANFKRLRMTINPGDHAITTADSARMSQIGLVPPYFALAFESKIATGTLLQRLQAADLVSPPEGKSWGPHDAGDAPQPPLDIVCILGEGVAMYHRPDNPLKFGITEGVPPDTVGWFFMPTDAPLAWTITWLHAAMPRILRSGSVLNPYLMPNQKNLKYMIERGYIKPEKGEPPTQGAPDASGTAGPRGAGVTGK